MAAEKHAKSLAEEIVNVKRGLTAGGEIANNFNNGIASRLSSVMLLKKQEVLLMRLAKLFQKTALLLILLMSFHTIVAPLASAALVGTDTLVSAQEVDASRARLAALLAREDIGAALFSHGISATEVLVRVNSLTDQEVIKLAQNIDALPAGADGGVGSVVGAIVFIFVVLLITDLLGLTDVFPFVRK